MADVDRALYNSFKQRFDLGLFGEEKGIILGAESLPLFVVSHWAAGAS